LFRLNETLLHLPHLLRVGGHPDLRLNRDPQRLSRAIGGGEVPGNPLFGEIWVIPSEPVGSAMKIYLRQLPFVSSNPKVAASAFAAN
jgi:hypothetical protein